MGISLDLAVSSGKPRVRVQIRCAIHPVMVMLKLPASVTPEFHLICTRSCPFYRDY